MLFFFPLIVQLHQNLQEGGARMVNEMGNIEVFNDLKVIIHLVRAQNFSNNYHFLPPDTRTNMCLSGGKKYPFFGKFCVRTKWMLPKLVGAFS